MAVLPNNGLPSFSIEMQLIYVSSERGIVRREPVLPFRKPKRSPLELCEKERNVVSSQWALL